MPTHQRPSWDEYFLNITQMVGTGGTCDRGRSGCLIVKNKRLISTGYVGSPIGMPHCDEVGHEMHTVINDDKKESHHCIRTSHAEQNAICQAARFGIALDGGTLYCHMTPCYVCAKMIINAGITRVVCSKRYHNGQKSEALLKQARIELQIINDETENYPNQ